MKRPWKHARSPFSLLLALIALALPRPAAGSAPVPEGEVLYVANQDDATVSVIDLETREVIRTVDLQALGYSANAKPHHIAVEPDGSYWYVSLIGEGQVVKLDRQDRVAGSAPFEAPGMLALHPEADRLFVGRSMSAVNPPQRVGVIRRSDMSIEEMEVFFPRPHALTLDPRTGIAYTASLATNQVAAVDPVAERAVITDVVGPQHGLMQFDLSPDGSMLAVSGEVSDQLLFFDVSRDPLRPERAGTVSVGAQPFDPVFTPDGRTVWLGNKRANTITAVDVETREVVTVLDDPRIRQPHGAAVSSDGRLVLISSNNTGGGHDGHGEPASGGGHEGHAAPASGPGNVVIIDAVSHRILDVVEVGRNAAGIAVGPR